MQKMVKILKALASETRLQIIMELLKDPKCATDLSSCIKKDLSTISRHLSILEDAGIIKVERAGKKIIVKLKNVYSIKKILKDLEEMCYEFV